MTSGTSFDERLLGRYDLAGPQEASRSIAKRMSAGFGEPELREAAQRSNGDPIPRQLSISLRFPPFADPQSDLGRDETAAGRGRQAEVYLARLYREIELTSSLHDRDRQVVGVHIGEGTLGFLSPAQLAEAIDVLRGRFRLSDAVDRELLIELEPRHVTAAGVADLGKVGFNQASLRAQDFEAPVQAPAGATQGVGAALGVVRACHASGLRSVNVDVVCGLPGQGLAELDRTLESVLYARVQRLVVYDHGSMPLDTAQRQIESSDPCAPLLTQELLAFAILKLQSAGYICIGMGHFVLPGDALDVAGRRGVLHRNLMGYTTHADTDHLGMGVGAISHVGDTYSRNPCESTAWNAALDAGRLPVCRGLHMSEDDIMRAAVIEILVCRGALRIGEFARRHSIDFSRYFSGELQRLEPLVADGLVELEPDRLLVTSSGRVLLRNIAQCFERLPGDLQPASGNQRRSARTE